MKSLIKFFRCLPFLVGLTFLILSPAYAAMDDYCVIPPFVVAGVKPNVLLMLDNSASTYDPVYLSSAQTYCYDNTYNNARNYIGYFSRIDPSAHTLSYPNYTYNFANGRFSEVNSIPGSCTYGGSSTAASYVCINTSGSGATETVTEFTASGRFLNWLAASKLDVEKTVLTGGKYDTASTTLIGESRGCVGRRFIRELPALAGITFAVRGPFAQEPDYVNPDTQGGLSRIEIYKGSYNENACQDAINAWLNDPLGQWITASRDCFGISGGAGTASGRELATFTEAARDCYQIKDNIAKGRTTPDDNGLFKNVTPTNLMTQCALVYTKDCPDPENIAACAILNDEKRGNYLCSASAIHIAPASPYYDSMGSDLTGFVGKCWSGAAGKFTGNEACVRREILHFCSGYSSAEVIDPSQGTTETTTGNIPAIIIDAGARALGDPLQLTQSFCIKDTARTCTQDSDCITIANDKCGRYFFSKAYVNTATTPAPKGLIHEFAVDKELIRFGAISFNCIGSASETVPGSCSTGINYDAGKIIAYIGDPAGDHSSGLIKAVDDIQGIAWTPFAEAFYNAIGYYSQDITKRVNSGASKDFETNAENPNRPNPIEYNCQRNYVLLITDGMSTADQNATVRNFVSNTIVPKETANSSNNDGQVTAALSPSYTTPPEYYGSKNLDDLSWFAYNYSIFDPTYNNFDPARRIQHVKDIITTHVVYTGDPCLLKDALGNCTNPNEADPERLMQETARYGGGTYQRVEDPAMLYTNLKKKFQEIAARSSSGTAASVLASGEGSGANLIQALFFPKRTFYNIIGSTEIEWTGSLHNFWYYIDPFLGNSSIREESNESSAPYTLNLQDDYVMHFRFPKSATDQNTVVDLYRDSDGDGDADIYAGTKYLDETIDPANRIKYLWEAGGLLWARPALTRRIYTHDGTGRVLLPDNITGGSPLITLMQTANANEATAIARYVKGIDLKVCSANKNICTTAAADCTAGETCDAYRNRTVTIAGVTNVWKLGDIVTSTPKIASWMPLNTYHKVYKDESYGPIGEDPKLTDPVDNNHFISTSGYKNRGMVFVGGNDGMLHAFKLGTVELFEEKYKKAALTGTNIGQEMWAYIPKHALPYLKHTADPNYCHLYFVDLVPSMFDVSIDGAPGDAISPGSWRTVLIGGMRFGGACKDAASTYGVKTPAAGKGYSSYFALDITDTLADPTNPPEVLWEFSDEQIAALWPGELATGGLGFSTSGPALVRTGEKGKNGRWFVVFGSGPTGPIDTVSHQFKGYSDQMMKLFIVDLKNGPVPGNARVINSNIPNAFSGSLIGSPIDLDQRKASALGSYYADDAIYFGYTRSENNPNPPTINTRWTMGGVMRLVTKESSDPGDWVLSPVISNIGPVTAAVAKLQNHKSGKEALWLFYGTGRYYYKIASDIDNATNRRALYGIKDPCYNHDPSGFPFKIDPACSDTVAFADIGDVTWTSANVTDKGWRISLDDCTKDDGTQVPCNDPTAVFRTERVTTDPLATPIGAVFYTTVKPSADVCEFGGVTHLWAVKYDTGGALKKGILRGKALIQVSTGSIEEKDLATAFTQKIDLGAGADAIPFRRTPPTPGLASSEKPQIAVPPKPINRILHIRER